jgi:hypothetical protein
MKQMWTLTAACMCLLASACSNEPISKERVLVERVKRPAMAVIEHKAYQRLPGRDQCEIGQKALCRPGGEEMDPTHPLMTPCERFPDGIYRFDFGQGSACDTPLALQLDDAPVHFTRPAGDFAIGKSARTEWISSETLWLGRDLDGSGCIENQGELFGVAPGDPWPDGFAKLALYDANADDAIDANDAIYSELIAWRDVNQDRACAPGEVSTLAALGIARLLLSAQTLPAKRSSFEGLTSTFVFGPEKKRGRLVDVFLLPM